MRRCVRKKAILLALCLAWLGGGLGRAHATEEAQAADPGRCQPNDAVCVQAWYKEYSAAILAELKYYAGQEGFLSQMLADPQEALITSRLSLVLIEGGVKYTQWAVMTDEDAAKDAHLDLARYKAIIGVCRDAIASMRGALFDLRRDRNKARGEANEYVKNAQACERTFGVRPIASPLRLPATARPAEKARSAPAASGDNAHASEPVDITPQARQP